MRLIMELELWEILAGVATTDPSCPQSPDVMLHARTRWKETGSLG
jgi:hypothetical protein